MKYLREYNTHASYETELNGGGVDISLPNVSYCEDVKDVHYNPYNTVEFYVGEITTPQTVYIYIVPLGSVDSSTEEVQVSEGNKWYTYVLPKGKGLLGISCNSIRKLIVKANIGYYDIDGDGMLYTSAVEASFKGSNTNNVTDMGSMFTDCSSLISLDVSSFDTSKVTNMYGMFYNCSGLKSLNLSGWDTSNVTDMGAVFDGCSGLTFLDLSGWNMSNVSDTTRMFSGCPPSLKIRMVGCSEGTINKIKAVMPSGASISTE